MSQSVPPPLDPPPPHWADTRPFDPAADADGSGRLPDGVATPLGQIWRKFKRHRLGVAALWVLGFLYLIVVPFAEVLAPYGRDTRVAEAIYHPPQWPGLVHEGGLAAPFVYKTQARIDLQSFRRYFVEDLSKPLPVRFFCLGEPYHLLGLFESRFKLICPPEGGTLFLFGADSLGRDLFSRLLHGARISLTVGLIGVAISFVLGIGFGGIAGYLGGWWDWAVLRLIELLRALPELPLWLALSAAIPPGWNPVAVFVGITVILGLLDWPGLALAVRAKTLQLREEEFTLAAEMMGARRRRILFRHIMPNFASHLIASVTLAIPAMILGETSLSFLGLGVREPMVSWGVLLNNAQDFAAIAVYPWMLLPVIPVAVTVLAFNYLGDGLRDAADPYRHV